MIFADWMKRKNLKDDDVAEKFRVHRVTALRWRLGHAKPSAEQMYAIHVESKGRVKLPDWFLEQKKNGRGA
jgi:transcriptional regulator with XRE-family HTH domain